MIIDAHAHVSSEKFAQDRDEVLARAWAAGVEAIVDVGCSVPSSEASLRLAERDPRIWAAVGVHPHDAKDWDDATRPALEALAASPRVVAIGETGLDFHYDLSPRDVQREVFRAHLRLATDLGKPLVLHVREAYDEALATLDEVLGAWPGDAPRGVSHCFTGTAEQALGFVRRGFHVSFTGVVTFKNAAQVQAAARAVPLDALMVETDCPYMAPVPHRGRRCEPAFVLDTARGVARLRGVEDEEVFQATVAATRRVFRLPGV
ncbi:MAG: TatD family hydrolase [Planctomycetes bacterium]|nr:TatD family hydrolase [Planctomycetota bacterium]